MVELTWVAEEVRIGPTTHVDDVFIDFIMLFWFSGLS